MSPRACPGLLSYPISTGGLELVPSPGSREGRQGKVKEKRKKGGDRPDGIWRYRDRHEGHRGEIRDREIDMKDPGREMKTEHQDQGKIQRVGTGVKAEQLAFHGTGWSPYLVLLLDHSPGRSHLVLERKARK